MGQGEFLLLFVVYAQPPVLGFALVSLSWGSLAEGGRLGFLGGARRRPKSIKFFECATYSRAGGRISYDLSTISLALVFILYDLDLIFFFSEATGVIGWGLVEWSLVCAYLLFFIVGVWYDKLRGGLGWSI
jgi:NADH:ubiquinone oxidoreductase subunit 3 (subunit A)